MGGTCRLNRRLPTAHLFFLAAGGIIRRVHARSGDAMTDVVGGLGINGVLMVIGAADSMQVSPMFLLTGCRSVKGWYSGTSIDSQDTLNFSSRTGVRSMNEAIPFERVAKGYERMMSGKARFRVVLTMGSI